MNLFKRILPVVAPGCFSLLYVLLLAVPGLSAQESASKTPEIIDVIVEPASLTLTGPGSRFSVLVHGKTSDGRIVDLTRKTLFRSLDSEQATVSQAGVIRSIADGTTQIQIEAAGRKINVPVTIRNAQIPRQYHFENDIVPIFTKFGCNSAGCHGKAEGKNGFKLSVFGSDPVADRVALTREARGRRVIPSIPDESLLLTKVSGGVPHGGGVRIRRGSPEYRTLRGWIASGLPEGDPAAPKVVSIQVTPSERQMTMNDTQQLRVVALLSDGAEQDVTQLAKFQTNNEDLADVDEFGLVASEETPGEVAVMASYMGAVDIFRALVPRPQSVQGYPEFPENNFIDSLVHAKLQKLNILPSDTCTDSEFLRRIYLDLIGTLPTAKEAGAFLGSKRRDKRVRLVNQLLTRPEFADFWALKWSDLLRVDRQTLGHKGAYSYYRWIRQSFADNKPYDQFVRELITAEGTLSDAPAGHFYQVVKEPGKTASTLSQTLLGVRIECCQCHHHPFDRWSQTDYFGMQAFFTQVQFKPTRQGQLLTASKNTKTIHPLSQQEVFAHALATENPTASPEGDRRLQLAEWITAPDNPWLAKNFVNRIWAHMLGRGLIEPVDDVRSTNPPTNPELLDALADHFVKSGFDIHVLMRTIATSRSYQLSSHPNETNERDEQNYSRALFKRLDAEVLFDAITQATGVDEKFDGLPAGYRAVQLWDSHVPHYFLKLFGRPTRATSCECERTVEPSVAQVLHVLNSPEIQKKLSHQGGRIASLVKQYPGDDARLIEELYLTFYSRLPDKDERKTVTEYLQNNSQNRRQAAEDLAWSMMNTVEFLFNH